MEQQRLLLFYRVFFGLISIGWIPAAAGQTTDTTTVILSNKIVPFVPTPQDVVERMLELAEVKKGDVVYDLGSGDGRIVITAAKKYGVQAAGFEIDRKLVQQSRETIRAEGLQNLARIHDRDIFRIDFRPATVVTMYLLPQVNLMLEPRLQEQLKPGSRVVSHDFDMGHWKPLKVEHMTDAEGDEHTLYLWQVERKTGRGNSR